MTKLTSGQKKYIQYSKLVDNLFSIFYLAFIPMYIILNWNGIKIQFLHLAGIYFIMTAFFGIIRALWGLHVKYYASAISMFYTRWYECKYPMSKKRNYLDIIAGVFLFIVGIMAVFSFGLIVEVK